MTESLPIHKIHTIGELAQSERAILYPPFLKNWRRKVLRNIRLKFYLERKILVGAGSKSKF